MEKIETARKFCEEVRKLALKYELPFFVVTDVSSHYLIRRDGHIKQIISLDDSAWANGTSKNDSSDVYYKFTMPSLIKNCSENANYFTFSIEHESFDGNLIDEQLKLSVKVMKEIINYVKLNMIMIFQLIGNI